MKRAGSTWPPALGLCLVLLLDGDDVPFHEVVEFSPSQFPAQCLIFDVGGQIFPLDAVLRVVPRLTPIL